MPEKEITIKGIHSGDTECWCFLVDKETFILLKGEEPGEFDTGRYAPEASPCRYMIYPGDIFAGARHDDQKDAVCTMYVKSSGAEKRECLHDWRDKVVQNHDTIPDGTHALECQKCWKLEERGT